MPIPPRVAAVLLDVDGTLLDSNAARAHAWAQALREHGLDTEASRIRPLIGMGRDKLLPAVASHRPGANWDAAPGTYGPGTALTGAEAVTGRSGT